MSQSNEKTYRLVLDDSTLKVHLVEIGSASPKVYRKVDYKVILSTVNLVVSKGQTKENKVFHNLVLYRIMEGTEHKQVEFSGDDEQKLLGLLSDWVDTHLLGK